MDGVLHHVIINLRQRLGESIAEHKESHEDCQQCNEISDPASPISASALASKTEVLDQIERVVADLQRNSEHLRLALRRQNWQRQAVDNDQSVSRRSTHFQDYDGEPYHKGEEGITLLN